MNRTKQLNALRFISYAALLLLAYVLQTTPHLFSIFGVKPMLLIPAAICVAMHEGELAGGIYGAAAGVLCDTAGQSFFGYYSILLLAACAAAGLLVIYMMNLTLKGAVLVVAAVTFSLCSLEYALLFGMWGYDGAPFVYAYKTLPMMIYTVAVTPAFYFTVKRIHRRLTSREPQ